jgi:hypothetical protein
MVAGAQANEPPLVPPNPRLSAAAKDRALALSALCLE